MVSNPTGITAPTPTWQPRGVSEMSHRPFILVETIADGFFPPSVGSFHGYRSSTCYLSSTGKPVIAGPIRTPC